MYRRDLDEYWAIHDLSIYKLDFEEELGDGTPNEESKIDKDGAIDVPFSQSEDKSIYLINNK